MLAKHEIQISSVRRTRVGQGGRENLQDIQAAREARFEMGGENGRQQA